MRSIPPVGDSIIVPLPNSPRDCTRSDVQFPSRCRGSGGRAMRDGWGMGGNPMGGDPDGSPIRRGRSGPGIVVRRTPIFREMDPPAYLGE